MERKFFEVSNKLKNWENDKDIAFVWNLFEVNKIIYSLWTVNILKCTWKIYRVSNKLLNWEDDKNLAIR